LNAQEILVPPQFGQVFTLVSLTVRPHVPQRRYAMPFLIITTPSLSHPGPPPCGQS
jgi:hypothetical protein